MDEILGLLLIFALVFWLLKMTSHQASYHEGMYIMTLPEYKKLLLKIQYINENAMGSKKFHIYSREGFFITTIKIFEEEFIYEFVHSIDGDTFSSQISEKILKSQIDILPGECICKSKNAQLICTDMDIYVEVSFTTQFDLIDTSLGALSIALKKNNIKNFTLCS